MHSSSIVSSEYDLQRIEVILDIHHDDEGLQDDFKVFAAEYSTPSSET